MNRSRWRPWRLAALAPAAVSMLALLAWPDAARGQYFGRNRVQYEIFDFEVLETEHFDVYHYQPEEEAAVTAARMNERWYARHSRILDHTLRGRQPFILYASHPHFRQSTAVSANIGEGTGGLTEPLKRRIILPMAGPLEETDHVIGHELVHGFQYDISGVSPTSPRLGAPAISGMPLWLVEGMAEYLSKGRRDPLTAMYLRDAMRSEKGLPTVRDLNNPREYFPYRFGQGLLAYVGGVWGADAVSRLFKASVQSGNPNRAIQGVLGVPPDTLASRWHAAVQEAYGGLEERTGPPSDFGQVLLSEERGGGTLNVGPALSPDGSRLLFLSERSRVAIELYLADAETGQIIRKITESAVDPHFQSLQFINSAGAWSADGSRIAFGAVSKGQPILVVMDPGTGDRVRELRFPRFGEVFNPTWSPDGERIAFVANSGGFFDLWVVELASGNLRRLTNDVYAELHPDWSPDGGRIAFATDRYGADLDGLRTANYQLATIDVSTGQVSRLASFPEAKNVNPQWDGTGALYFVANPNGISNVHRLDAGADRPVALTNLYTGVVGITELSPTISVARDAERLVFTAFEDGDNNIYRVDAPSEKRTEVATPPDGTDMAMLPPPQPNDTVLTGLLANAELGLPNPVTFSRHDYHPSLALDYIAQPTFGLGISNYGSFVGGGAALHFSDMLGYHNLLTQLQLQIINGNVAEGIGAVGQYVNSERRLNWGLVAGQVPQFTQGFGRGVVDEDGDGTADRLVQETFNFWQVNRQAMGLLRYPFSEVQRVELTAGFEQIDFTLEKDSLVFAFPSGRQVEDRTVTAPACGPGESLRTGVFCEPGALSEFTASAALVYDNSISGPTGPFMGQRYRLELSPSIGTLTYATALGDYRKYFLLADPLSFATRGLHYGRYGSDAGDDRLARLYLGYPSLVRGYGSGSFDLRACPQGQPLERCSEIEAFNQLFGTRMAVANAELRLSLVGPFGIFGQGAFLPTDLVAFYDAGTAWRSDDPDTPEVDEGASFFTGDTDPVDSAGIGLRFNFLGFALAEVDWVVPFDRPDKGGFVSFTFGTGF